MNVECVAVGVVLAQEYPSGGAPCPLELNVHISGVMEVCVWACVCVCVLLCMSVCVLPQCSRSQGMLTVTPGEQVYGGFDINLSKVLSPTVCSVYSHAQSTHLFIVVCCLLHSAPHCVER